MVYEGTLNGMSSPLAVGKLARLAGADIVMVNTPYGGYPLSYQKYMQTIEQLVLPFYHLKHPCLRSAEVFIQEWWKNISGKSDVISFWQQAAQYQGHPGGATAGSKGNAPGN